jgi:hypothetical protein
MTWQGDGTFVRSNGTNTGAETWQDDAAAAVKIVADRHDTHDQDLADGIAACLTKNMETKPTADFVPNTTGTYDLGTTSLKWEDLHLNGAANIGGLTTVGGNIVSDTDSTDDLGTTSVRWANAFVDAITVTDSITLGSDEIHPPSLASLQTPSGVTEADFESIPSWVTQITLSFNGISTSGTSDLLVRLGDASSYEATGYVAFATRVTDSNTVVNALTNGFHLDSSTAASDAAYGSLGFTMMDSSTNLWALQGVMGKGANSVSFVSGTKALTGALTRIRVTTAGGSDTLDAGTVNIRYA